MKLKVKGIITAVGQLKQGVSQTGNAWAVQEFIVTDSHNELVCFEVFGQEQIATFSVGQSVNVECNLQVREWNGKYFTSIRYIAPRQETPQQESSEPTQAVVQPQPQQQPMQQIPKAQSQVTYAQPYVAPQPQQQPTPQQQYAQPQAARFDANDGLPF